MQDLVELVKIQRETRRFTSLSRTRHTGHSPVKPILEMPEGRPGRS